MDQQQLKNRIHLLNKLSQINKRDRSRFLKECNSLCIHAICEACYNVLYNTLKLEDTEIKQVKKKLGKIKEDFKKLSERKVSLNIKRKLLSKPQTGEGIFTLLASTVIPALVSLLSRK